MFFTDKSELNKSRSCPKAHTPALTVKNKLRKRSIASPRRRWVFRWPETGFIQRNCREIRRAARRERLRFAYIGLLQKGCALVFADLITLIFKCAAFFLISILCRPLIQAASVMGLQDGDLSQFAAAEVEVHYQPCGQHQVLHCEYYGNNFFHCGQEKTSGGHKNALGRAPRVVAPNPNVTPKIQNLRFLGQD